MISILLNFFHGKSNYNFGALKYSPKIQVGELIFLEVIIGANEQFPIDAAQIVVDFDSTYLQPVSIDNQTVSQITDGEIITSGVWEDILANSVSTGKIKYSAGKGLGGQDAIKDFQLAKWFFRTLAATENTNIIFNTTDAFRTKFVYKGKEVQGSLNNLNIMIVGS